MYFFKIFNLKHTLILVEKTLQIFDLDKKAKVKTHQATEDIIFWNWVNSDTIGIVTESAVLHWSLNGNN